ncbi:MAG: inorganic diphosphatase [Thermoplasmata archaeon]|uniref:Inorganic pyrophosphatase n=1 Tax=Candidatus Aciduliprofundum boonei TaxID=379547 RepID=A0A7J3T9W3_9ARCH|nr:inorganic diphosphatase [Thermoplasmata archaeon]HHE75721.1 inorganic diphosphatase [Candidatus Aciduliprofundum boonei]
MKSGENPPEDIYVFIEVPKGSNIKCEYDFEMKVIKVDRVLHTASFYPFNYGFIPNTREEDGDPIDCLVISYDSLPHGVVVRSVPVGMLVTEDEHGVDRKIIAIPHPQVDPRGERIKDIGDIPKGILRQIEHFFEHYKELEKNKWVKIIGFKNAKDAKDAIKMAMERFKNGSGN